MCCKINILFKHGYTLCMQSYITLLKGYFVPHKITLCKCCKVCEPFVCILSWCLTLKPLDTFWTKQKLKVHRFKNNEHLQGLQNVMVKDFPSNIIPWNALLFERTLKQLSILDIENNGFILNTCQDTAKRWPIEPFIFTGLLFDI